MIYQGDSLEILKTLPDNSIDCCVTSPPYFGQRHYKTNPVIWDNHNGCEHEWGNDYIKVQSSYLLNYDNPKSTLTTGTSQARKKEHSDNKKIKPHKSQFCLHCNAWRGELGLEPTYQLYIQHLLQIFDEIKRVLKKTGTCWVVIDDSYAGSNCGHGTKELSEKQKSNTGTNFMTGQKIERLGCPAKSLMAIPQRFQIAMIDSGWICRNVVIWHKPNAMPESCKDRFTNDFEYCFFFSKSGKYYFEQQFDPSIDPESFTGRRQRNEGNINLSGGYLGGDHNHFHKILDGTTYPEKNKRTTWTIPTQSSGEEHFATYPEDLIIPMIKAGCPKGGTVLDPFSGIGTTGIVAKKLNCNYIGIELNPKYKDISERRLNEFEMLPL